MDKSISESLSLASAFTNTFFFHQINQFSKLSIHLRWLADLFLFQFNKKSFIALVICCIFANKFSMLFTIHLICVFLFSLRNKYAYRSKYRLRYTIIIIYVYSLCIYVWFACLFVYWFVFLFIVYYFGKQMVFLWIRNGASDILFLLLLPSNLMSLFS